MTKKQRNYIIYLESKCIEQGLDMRASDEDLLGEDWLKDYQNFIPKYVMEVIDKFKRALGMPIQEYNPKRRKRK